MDPARLQDAGQAGGGDQRGTCATREEFLQPKMFFMINRDWGTCGRPLKPNSGVFDLIRTSGDFDHRFLCLNTLARVQCSTVHSQCKEGLSIRQRVLALCVDMSFTPDSESPQTQMKERRLQRHRTLYLQVHTCTTAVILVARSLTLAVQNCTGDPVDDNH